jgi:hypothetical protein
VLVLLLASLLSVPALAQDPKAAAVLAYDEAEKSMAAGKIDEACARYAESQRLDPQLGTLLHLADCLEQNGQTASAWASFREAAELAEKNGDQRRELARARVERLVPRLSHLRIDVSQGAELQVERDGIIVGAALWGAPIPTDPGVHTITAKAPGRRSWSGTAVVKADGASTTVSVPELAREVPVSPEAQVSLAPAAQTEASRIEPREQSSLAERWPALAAGGVGVVGVVVGSIFGLQSMSKQDEAAQHCNGSVCSDQAGVRLKDEAMAAGNISTVAFIVGGVGLAAGGVLWFTLPVSGESARRTARGDVHLGFGPSRIVVEHRW